MSDDVTFRSHQFSCVLTSDTLDNKNAIEHAWILFRTMFRTGHTSLA